MKVFLSITLLVVNASSLAWASAPSDTVKQFIQAYNQHNLDNMLHLVSEDMQWLYNVENKLIVETDNKETLKQAMESHFKQRPQARSEIKDILAFGTAVVVVEEAFSNKSQTSQCALSIYQVEQNLITSVIYYQATPCQ